MELSSWLTIAGICTLGAISPGPSLAVVVKNTVAGGRTQGILTGLGHGFGVGLYAFGAVVGVSALVASQPALARAIEVAGALYLLWMGWQTLRHARQTAIDSPQHSRPGIKGFSEGFLIAFLNPKIAVFFLALLGSFLPVGASVLERTGVASLAMTIDGVWYMFAAALLAGTGAAGWLAHHGIWLDRTLAAVLVGVALSLLVAGT